MGPGHLGPQIYGSPPAPAAPQDPPGPSYAVATLQASVPKVRGQGGGWLGVRPTPLLYPQAVPAPHLPPQIPKRRPPPSESNGTPQKRAKTPPETHGSTHGSSPHGSTQGSATHGATHGGGPILGGVVLALSGFQNPLRSRLRAAAVGLGASYRPDWGPDSTHLM